MKTLRPLVLLLAMSMYLFADKSGLDAFEPDVRVTYSTSSYDWEGTRNVVGILLSGYFDPNKEGFGIGFEMGAGKPVNGNWNNGGLMTLGTNVGYRFEDDYKLIIELGGAFQNFEYMQGDNRTASGGYSGIRVEGLFFDKLVSSFSFREYTMNTGIPSEDNQFLTPQKEWSTYEYKAFVLSLGYRF